MGRTRPSPDATLPHEFVVSPNPYKSALACAICGVVRHKHPAAPTHMQFVGGTVYCSVKGGRLNLGHDHRYGRDFVCPHCGAEVGGRLKAECV